MTDYDALSMQELDALAKGRQRDDRAVVELLRRVHSLEGEDRSTVSMTLVRTAKEHPERVLPHVSTIAYLIGSMTRVQDSDVHEPELEPAVLTNLLDLLTNLFDEHPEIFSEVAGVFERQMRIPDEFSLSGTPTDFEGQVIVRSLRVWKEASKRGHEIPDSVVENAVELFTRCDGTGSTRFIIITLLENALRNGSPKTELVLGLLGVLAGGAKKRYRRAGSEPLARLAVETDVEFPRPVDFADRIARAKKIDRVDEELIDRAVDELNSREPPEGDYDDIFDFEELERELAPDTWYEQLFHDFGVGWR